MDVLVHIVEQLKCGHCGTPLSRAPVYQQRDGAAACAQCLCPERPAMRNRQYEAAAKLLRFRFPCRYQKLGCKETVPFVGERQDVPHEAQCKYHYHKVCPMLSASRCAWRGPKYRILQHCRAQHPGQEWLVTCVGCKVETALLYHGAHGWLCERCAPARRACKIEGCTYRDYLARCEKHERYFCERSTKCNLCDEGIPRGTLAAHYAAAHGDRTCSAGATWRARATGDAYGLLDEKCWFHVTCPAGIAVCYYWLDESQFVLYVGIPVPSERQCEFRCEVRVTEPTTGFTHTNTYDRYYDDKWDWDVSFDEDDFPNWSDEFDVCVNITNI